MTEVFGVASQQHLLPPRTVPGGNVSQPPTSSDAAVPAGAEAPVYQPWVQVLADAESKLKTEVQTALRKLDKTTTDAGRILDAARAIATEQAKTQEAAAWVAWNTHMQAAAEIYSAVMDPALRAYTEAVTTAHGRLRHDLGPVYDAYKKITGDATWAQQITAPPATSM